MIYFTELDDDNTIVFQFLDKELPESVPMGKRVSLNKIEYAGGFQTNQIMGVFRQDIEWEGVFFGTYGNGKTAKERYDDLEKLLGRPVRVGFPVGGQGNAGDNNAKNYGGEVGVYVIEEISPVIKNYLHVEYRIKLVPHDLMKKIKPSSNEVVRLQVNPQVTSEKVSGVKRKVAKGNHPSLKKKGPKVADDVNNRTKKFEAPEKGLTKNYHKNNRKDKPGY